MCARELVTWQCGCEASRETQAGSQSVSFLFSLARCPFITASHLALCKRTIARAMERRLRAKTEEGEGGRGCSFFFFPHWAPPLVFLFKLARRGHLLAFPARLDAMQCKTRCERLYVVFFTLQADVWIRTRTCVTASPAQ